MSGNSISSEPKRAISRKGFEPVRAPDLEPSYRSAEPARELPLAPAPSVNEAPSLPREEVRDAERQFITDIRIAHEMTNGARHNRESSEKDKATATGWVVNLFSGGATTKQIEAEKKHEAACAAKEIELAERLGKRGVLSAAATAQREAEQLEKSGDAFQAGRMRENAKLLTDLASKLKDDQAGFTDAVKAAEAATQKSAEFERAGDARGAADAREVARQLYAIAPAMLEAPDETFRVLSRRVKEADDLIRQGRPGDFSAARNALHDAEQVYAVWSQNVDPKTGVRPRLSRMADASELAVAYRSSAQGFANAEKYLGWTETGIKVAATLAVATVAIAASGGLVLAPGLVIGASWLGGLAVGIGCGLLVGATAAYGESIGKMLLGLKPKSLTGIFDAEANQQMWEHAKTAVLSVGFAKAFQLAGALAGYVEGMVGTTINRGVAWCVERTAALVNATPVIGSIYRLCGWVAAKTGIPTLMARITPWFTTRLVQSTGAATFSGGTVGVMSWIDGQHEINNARSDWVAFLEQHPEALEGIRNEKDLWKREEEFLAMNGLTQKDILMKSLRNAGIAGLTAFLHVRLPASTASTAIINRLGRESLVQGTPMALGAAQEYLMHDGEVDFGDGVGIVTSGISGRMIGEGYRGGYQTGMAHNRQIFPGRLPPIPPAPTNTVTTPTFLNRLGTFISFSIPTGIGLAVLYKGLSDQEKAVQEDKDGPLEEPIQPFKPLDIPRLQRDVDPIHPNLIKRLNEGAEGDRTAMSTSVKLPRINAEFADRVKGTV